MKKITLTQIAKIAGVSTATVSRVFNRKELHKVSPAKRKAVEQILKEYHYTPDANGRRLVSGCSHLIGFMMQSFRSPIVNSAFLEEISLQASQLGYGLIAALCQQQATQIDAVKQLISQGIDGLIWQPLMPLEEDFVNFLQDSGLKVVWFNRVVQSPFPIVHSDEELTGSIAADYLVKHGAKQCTFIANTQYCTDSHSKWRWSGFKKQLELCGVDCDVVDLPEVDKLKADSAFWSPERGIFSANHQVAIMLEHEKRRRGIENCPIIAYGDRDIAEQYDSPLPLISPDCPEMSRAALQELFSEDSTPNRKILIPPQIVLPQFN